MSLQLKAQNSTAINSAIKNYEKKFKAETYFSPTDCKKHSPRCCFVLQLGHIILSKAKISESDIDTEWMKGKLQKLYGILQLLLEKEKIVLVQRQAACICISFPILCSNPLSLNAPDNFHSATLGSEKSMPSGCLFSYVQNFKILTEVFQQPMHCSKR